MAELTAFCNDCGAVSPYKIAIENVRTERDGIEFEFPCGVGICEKCGGLIFSMDLHERNIEAKELAYLKSKKLHDSFIV